MKSLIQTLRHSIAERMFYWACKVMPDGDMRARIYEAYFRWAVSELPILKKEYKEKFGEEI